MTANNVVSKTECDMASATAGNAIDTVMVFTANKAEIRRKAVVGLKQGQNEVLLKHLPSILEKGSVRVEGIGRGAVILDVICHDPEPYDSTWKDEATREIRDRKDSLCAELQLVNDQSSFLKKYGESFTGEHNSVDDLQNFLGVFATRARAFEEARQKLTNDINKVDEEMREKTKVLDEEEEAKLQRLVNITVIVEANHPGEAEFWLTYMVANASWTPEYDLRATLAPVTSDTASSKISDKSGSKPDTTIKLNYRASITQSTGEDWKDVTLVLSTASPSASSKIPTLTPQWLNEGPKPQVYATRGLFGASRTGSSRTGSPQLMMAMAAPPAPPPPGAMASPPPPPPPAPIPQRATVASGDGGSMNTTFNIPGATSIPTNTLNKNEDHKVTIADIECGNIEMQWITVPKQAPKAFLQSKVKNTSGYTLLQGETNVFLNNNFVAKSSISHVSPQETFSVSLGADPGVRVTYHPQRVNAKTTGSALMNTKMSSTVYEQRITIKNTRLTNISPVIVRDQVPVARDAKLKVNLNEPKDLGRIAASVSSGGGPTKAVTLSKSVKARWAKRTDDNGMTLEDGDDGEAGGDPGLGLVEWICDVGPSGSTDLTLAWEVVVPAGTEWHSA